MCFMKKKGQRGYKYLVLGRGNSYFVSILCKGTKTFFETDIINMFEFLIDNIFAMFRYQLFSSSRRLVPLFVRGRLHTGLKQKEGSPNLCEKWTKITSARKYPTLLYTRYH